MSGYRDLMFCVLYKGPMGLNIVAEVQLQDQKLYRLKLQVPS